MYIIFANLRVERSIKEWYTRLGFVIKAKGGSVNGKSDTDNR